MCNFFSFLIMRDGEVKWHPMLDSHTDLVNYFGIRDGAGAMSSCADLYAKGEFTPPAEGSWLDLDKWAWKIDEDTRPQWLDECEGRAQKIVRGIIERSIIGTGQQKNLIVDGFWIVGGDAKISDVRAGRIMRIQDSATVSGVGGSATVSGVGGSATVSGVWDSATVSGVWGSATVSGVWDSATVSGVRDSATVSGVGGSATVSGVGKNVTLDESAKAHLKEPTHV